MRLFTMGTTGYIGSVVAEYLQRDGHELVGLARSQKSADRLDAMGIEVVRGELGDIDLIREQVEKADGVVQVTTGGFMLQALTTIDAVLNTTRAVIDAAKGTNKPLLMTYGIAAWMDTGWYDVERVVTEDDPISWQYFYAHLAESQRMYEAADVRHIGIFPGGVYGRGGSYIGGIARAFDCVRKHGKMYVVQGADNAASHVHIDDLAELYVLALRSPETRGRFIASSQIDPGIETCRAVSEAAGLGGEIHEVTSREMRDLCGRYREVDFFMNIRCSGQKAKDVLGWKPSGPTLKEELASLPKPLDINSVYPSPDRLAAKMAAMEAAASLVTNGNI